MDMVSMQVWNCWNGYGINAGVALLEWVWYQCRCGTVGMDMLSMQVYNCWDTVGNNVGVELLGRYQSVGAMFATLSFQGRVTDVSDRWWATSTRCTRPPRAVSA